MLYQTFCFIIRFIGLLFCLFVNRFWAFMDRTERHTNYPNLFRSTSLIHYLLVIFHWNGCLYHIIYKNNGFGSKNWVFNDSETADVVKQYLQSYYWCTLALTTIGDLPRYLLIYICNSTIHSIIKKPFFVFSFLYFFVLLHTFCFSLLSLFFLSVFLLQAKKQGRVFVCYSSTTIWSTVIRYSPWSCC